VSQSSFDQLWDIICSCCALDASARPLAGEVLRELMQLQTYCHERNEGQAKNNETHRGGREKAHRKGKKQNKIYNIFHIPEKKIN